MAKDTKLQSEIKKTLQYKEYSDDIFQDILLQVLTTNNEQKLIDICQRNEFKFWIFHIIKAQKTNNKYKNINELFNEEYCFNFSENLCLETEEKEHRRFIIQIITEELEQMHWYKRKVFQEYVQMKKYYESIDKKFTFREFGREFNIKKSSLWELVKNVKVKLNKKINEHI